MIIQRFQHLDLDDLLDDLEVFSKHFLIILDFLPCLDTIGAFMLKATVNVVILIYEEVDDVFYSENVETVLDLLCIDPFH